MFSAPPGLPDILKIDPIVYSWNTETGNDTARKYSSFSVQNVRQAIPKAVGQIEDGYLTLSERLIIAVLVNSVKTLKEKIDLLQVENQEMKNQLKKLIDANRP